MKGVGSYVIHLPPAERHSVSQSKFSLNAYPGPSYVDCRVRLVSTIDKTMNRSKSMLGEERVRGSVTSRQLLGSSMALASTTPWGGNNTTSAYLNQYSHFT